MTVFLLVTSISGIVILIFFPCEKQWLLPHSELSKCVTGQPVYLCFMLLKIIKRGCHRQRPARSCTWGQQAVSRKEDLWLLERA